MLSSLFSYTAFADFKLPDSGQTKCYQTVTPYAETSCNGAGQDGSYSINPLSYTDNGNGTVTDTNTGLMWQQEDNKTTYNWYQASGTYSVTYNPDAINYCGALNLGNYTDWRLPTKTELMGIVDFSVPYSNPSILNTYFLNTNQSNYWTSTVKSGSFPWVIDFATGNSRRFQDSSTTFVRCVRGEVSPQALVDNGNGIVTDSISQLMWQQDEPGQMIWGSALTYCEELTLGGHLDWRLPNIKELTTLLDDSTDRPEINTTYFPNAISSWYWSSTTGNFSGSGARYVDFTWGSINSITKSGNEYTRCVRGGNPGAGVNLSIAKNGNGAGSITADSGSIQWTGNIGIVDYLFGAVSTLSTKPDDSSLFSGWSGCGITNASTCTVTMIGDVKVTALFNLKPLRISRSAPIYFTTFQSAYEEVFDGESIEAEGVNFPENLTINKHLAINGGFSNSYSENSGFTSVNGLIVKGGHLAVKNLIIRDTK